MMTAKAIMSMNTVTMMKKNAFFPNLLALALLGPSGEGEVEAWAISGSGSFGPARIRWPGVVSQLRFAGGR
jgi:hypothetical protein